MKELNKFLKQTKEITFIRFLDYYSDLSVSYIKKKNSYDFTFPAVNEYDEETVSLDFDSNGELLETSCSCHDNENGYCIHELGAFIKYLELNDETFDIIEYLMEEEKLHGADSIWLETANFNNDYFEDFDDELLDNLNLSHEELQEIMEFDIGMVLEEMNKQEIIDFIRDVAGRFPVAKLALLQHMSDIAMNEYESYDEEQMDEVLYQNTNRKPS